MSSHKNIIFFIKDESHDDVTRLYNVIKKHGEFEYERDDRKFNMGWSETYWMDHTDIWWFKQPENWDYYGIEDIDIKFKDYKIVAHISEQMDYDNPHKFNKNTKSCFKKISDEMGENEIYTLIYDESSNEEIIYLPILNTWRGCFYETSKQRDKTLRRLL
jgi:hypothetical protein